MPFRWETYESPYVGSIAELMQGPARARAHAARASAEARARAMEQSGQAYARMGENLGQIAGNTLGSYLQSKQDAPRREMEQMQIDAAKGAMERSRQLRELFSGERPPTDDAIIGIMGPEDGLKIVQGLRALRGDPAKEYADSRKVIRDVLAGLDALPEDLRAETYPGIRQNLIARQVIRPEDAPEQYDAGWFQQARNYGAEPPKPAEPYTLNPGDVRFDASNTQVAAVPKAVEAPKAGTFEDYLTRFAAEKGRNLNQLTPADLRAAKAQYEAAGRAPQQPPQPVAPTVIPGPNGPLLLDKGSNKTTPVLGPDGKPLGAAPTADMRNKAEGRKLVEKSVKALRSLSEKVITTHGLAQRATAVKRGIKAKLGDDPEFRTYQDARMALAGNLAVAQQGSRVSDADVKAIWLPMVPDIFEDTDESALLKWGLIDQMSGLESGAAPTASTTRRNPFR